MACGMKTERIDGGACFVILVEDLAILWDISTQVYNSGMKTIKHKIEALEAYQRL